MHVNLKLGLKWAMLSQLQFLKECQYYVVASKVQVLSHVRSYIDVACRYKCMELATEGISNPHPPQPLMPTSNKWQVKLLHCYVAVVHNLSCQFTFKLLHQSHHFP